MARVHNLGFPRIGAERELKFALEKHWQGALSHGELELLGSHGMAAHEYPSMLGAVASGDFRPVELVGRTIALDDVPAALASMGTAGGAGSGMTVVEL